MADILAATDVPGTGCRLSVVGVRATRGACSTDYRLPTTDYRVVVVGLVSPIVVVAVSVAEIGFVGAAVPLTPLFGSGGA